MTGTRAPPAARAGAARGVTGGGTSSGAHERIPLGPADKGELQLLRRYRKTPSWMFVRSFPGGQGLLVDVNPTRRRASQGRAPARLRHRPSCIRGGRPQVLKNCPTLKKCFAKPPMAPTVAEALGFWSPQTVQTPESPAARAEGASRAIKRAAEGQPTYPAKTLRRRRTSKHPKFR